MRILKIVDNILDFVSKEIRQPFKKQYKVCPNGHNIYNFNDKYCWVCSAKLIITDINPRPEIKCPKCNKKPESRVDNYCVQCGTQLRIC